MGQRCCLPEENPAHEDDAEAQLVDSGEREGGGTSTVHQESNAGVDTAAAGKSGADAGVGDTKGAAGTDATGDASQCKGKAAKATEGTSKSGDPSEQKKRIHATGKSTEHQEAASKPKQAVAADRVSGEHVAATTTKTADDIPIVKKSASTAAVHKATGTRSKNRKDDASKGEAAGEHRRQEDKPDEQRGTTGVKGTSVKAADAAAAQQPSSAKQSSAVPPSHVDVRASPTGDANAPPAAAQRPGAAGTGNDVPAAPANSSSAGTVHPAEEDEEEEKGIYRVHQFNKVEMFGFAPPGQSVVLRKEFVEIQKEICRDLKLHVQLLDMPPIDLGLPAYRKLDMEAWMPGSRKYGEISSASDCTDYQSRRLGITCRQTLEGPPSYVFTTNGTALAVPRMLIAIVENYQQKDNSVVIPDVLRKYMDDKALMEQCGTERTPRSVPFYFMENR